MSDSSLVVLGWDSALDDERAAMPDGEGTPARVQRIDRKWCTVLRAPDDAVRLPAPEDLAVGDWVLLPEAADRIADRVPRKSALARRAPDGSASAQVIAANVDWVFLVHGLVIDPNERRLERELVIAYESGAMPVVVLTTADLAEDPRPAQALVEEVAAGVPVHVVSSLTGEGLSVLDQYLAGHRTIVLLGPSGAGKSTLINALMGEALLRTAEVREFDGKGRHTTTAAELVLLPAGGLLVDTPGLRALALWSEGAGLDEAFADVTSLAEHCRFRDCAHDVEPGCAVLAAVQSGTLLPARLRSWRNLHVELEALRGEQEAYERSAGRGRRRPRRGGPADDVDDERTPE
ncbi:MAG TPA: ribosome small subunit-dependent GTPase A [Acidimicrobiales bacterium]